MPPYVPQPCVYKPFTDCKEPINGRHDEVKVRPGVLQKYATCGVDLRPNCYTAHAACSLKVSRHVSRQKRENDKENVATVATKSRRPLTAAQAGNYIAPVAELRNGSANLLQHAPAGPTLVRSFVESS